MRSGGPGGPVDPSPAQATAGLVIHAERADGRLDPMAVITTGAVETQGPGRRRRLRRLGLRRRGDYASNVERTDASAGDSSQLGVRRRRSSRIARRSRQADAPAPPAGGPPSDDGVNRSQPEPMRSAAPALEPYEVAQTLQADLRQALDDADVQVLPSLGWNGRGYDLSTLTLEVPFARAGRLAWAMNVAEVAEGLVAEVETGCLSGTQQPPQAAASGAGEAGRGTTALGRTRGRGPARRASGRASRDRHRCLRDRLRGGARPLGQQRSSGAGPAGPDLARGWRRSPGDLPGGDGGAGMAHDRGPRGPGQCHVPIRRSAQGRRPRPTRHGVATSPPTVRGSARRGRSSTGIALPGG